MYYSFLRAWIFYFFRKLNFKRKYNTCTIGEGLTPFFRSANSSFSNLENIRVCRIGETVDVSLRRRHFTYVLHVNIL